MGALRLPREVASLALTRLRPHAALRGPDRSVPFPSGQLRLAVRHLLPRMVVPMAINMPGAGGTLPKTICSAARSSRSQVVRDYFVWVV